MILHHFTAAKQPSTLITDVHVYILSEATSSACASVWSPHYLNVKDLLERVPHRFTRTTEGYSSLPYAVKLLRLGLWMLEERRN